MNKSLILLFLWITTITGTLRAGIIEKVYTVSDHNVSRSGEFSIINLENGFITAEVGKPELPWFTISLLIPPGEKAISIEVIREEKIDIPGNYKLYPYQPPRKISEGKSDKITIDKAIYESKLPYPQKISGKLLTQYMNGFTFAISSFTPAEYIPAEGRFSYYRKVSVRIHTAPADQPSSVTAHDKAAIERVKRFAQNPELTDLYPPVTDISTDYEILILVPTAFAGSFTSLIDLYYVRGYKTKVKEVSWIYSNISGSDNQQKIRNYIIQEYQNNNIDHVILAGDADLVPYRGFTDSVYSGGSWTIDTGIPSDIYYSALDGSWNTDGDAYWGELNEMDLLPEISVGRLPAGNTTELASILNKTIMYQNHPVVADLRKPFLVGEHLYDNPLTEGGYFMELLIGYKTDNGYTTNGITSWHNIQRLYDHLLPSQWTKTTLLAKINEGHSFLHHVGHANSTYLMRLYNSDITNANFSSINGTTHGYMPVYSHGCICGSFDYNDCIGEKMVIINNFACAFVGNSRYGWFNEGTNDGPSEHLHREFVDALYFDREPTIGMAHTISKVMTAPFVTASGQWEPGAQRWVMYDCNVLGDPVMHVWTDLPLDVSVDYPDSILVSSSGFTCSIDTSGTPVNGVRASLLQSNVLIATALSNAYGQASISIPASTIACGPAQLIISGYNCIPDTLPINVVNTISNQALQWTGAVSSDWSDASNWSNGVPDSTTDISIDPSANNPAINSNITIRNLTIKPECQLSLNSGKFLTVKGDFIIETPQGLIVKSDATGTGSFIAGDTIIYNNGGSATIEQYIEADKIYYLSPPVSGLTRQSAFAGALKLFHYDASTGNWVQLAIDNTSLEIMRGYVVKYSTTQTLSFSGQLNTGTHTAGSVGHIALAQGPNYGWNLIGNPYSSAIEVGTELLPVNGWMTGSNIMPFVSYRKTDGNIAYFSKIGSGTGVNDGTNFIPPSQAYWININGTTNIDYQTTKLVCRHNTQNIFKNSINSSQVFRITAFHNTYKDETVVGFYDQADSLADRYDIPKMFVDDTNFAMIFTIAGTDKLALNGLPLLSSVADTNITIPLGFKCTTTGNFSFVADVSKVDTSILVQLEDLQTGILQNLRANPLYSFQSPTANTTSRFKLRFTPARIWGNLVYAGGNNHPISNVEVTLRDTAGNLLESSITGANGEFSFKLLPSSAQLSVQAVIAKTPGGINAVDALAVLKHFTNIQLVTGLQLKAADVNADNFVNSIDALLIQKRFVQMISSLPAGEWIVENISLQPIQAGEQKHVLLEGICVGDVNSSYIP